MMKGFNFILLIMSLFPSGVLAVEIELISDLPSQLNENSCQSNFLAWSLSTQYPNEFPVKNYEEFSSLEKRIREAILEQSKGKSPNHVHIQNAIIKLTNNKHQLLITDCDDINEAKDVIKKNVVPRLNLVAGVSVTRIGSESYSGHIITVLETNVKNEFTIFNSWVKINGKRIKKGNLIQISNIEFKIYNYKNNYIYKVFYIR